VSVRELRMSARRKVALVSSHGGHLSEALLLRKMLLPNVEVFHITYDSIRTRDMNQTYLIKNIGVNPVRMVIAIFRLLAILSKEKPDAILSTGAEIAIPAFLIGRATGCKLIFIETLARVTRPSLTGKLVYPMSHYFFVQWPQLKRHYGNKAEYAGSVL
jgi:UDP-N-acetylglucosamine:LPS N-acetylglucosamine transferase